MSVQSKYKINFKFVVYILIGSLFIFILLQVAIDKLETYATLNEKFVNFMKRKLVYEKHIPYSLLNKMSGNMTLIYVLGGNQDSLRYRFKEASILYHQGLSNKILILSRPGITDYDSDLGRNLKNNEWAIMELGKFNVKKEDIEPVSVRASFFGTLSEAKDLTDCTRKKGYSKLVLVTSAYHTKRTITTFSKFAQNSSIELYIYGSDDVSGFQGLIIEYIKMLLYENFVLPVYSWKETKDSETRASTLRPVIEEFHRVAADEGVLRPYRGGECAEIGARDIELITQ